MDRLVGQYLGQGKSYTKEAVDLETFRQRRGLEPLFKRNTKLYQDSKNSRKKVLTMLGKDIQEYDANCWKDKNVSQDYQGSKVPATTTESKGT